MRFFLAVQRLMEKLEMEDFQIDINGSKQAEDCEMEYDEISEILYKLDDCQNIEERIEVAEMGAMDDEDATQWEDEIRQQLGK